MDESDRLPFPFKGEGEPLAWTVSRPANGTTPYPPGGSPFEKLPPELHQMILYLLASCGNELGISSDYVRTRQDLGNLSLAAKTLRDAAQEVLFRNVAFYHPTSLIRLYGLLCENPKFAVLVRHLKLSLNLQELPGRRPHGRGRRSSEQPAFDQIDFSPLRSSSDPVIAHLGCQPATNTTQISRRTAQNLLYACFFKVLCQTKNLLSLDFQVPAYLSQPLRGLMPWDTWHSLEVPVRDLQGEEDMISELCRQWYGGQHVPSLPALAKLTLRGTQVVNDPVSIDFCRGLMQLPGLQEIECVYGGRAPVRAESQTWVGTLLPNHLRSMVDGADLGNQPSSSNLRTLVLSDTICAADDLFNICMCFPGLECLQISAPVKYGACNQGSVDRFAGRFLSEALSNLKELQTFHLDTHYGDAIYPLLGPAGALDLSTLSNLRELKIPLEYLFGVVDGENQRQWLSNMLPRPLRQLTLLVTRYGVGLETNPLSASFSFEPDLGDSEKSVSDSLGSLQAEHGTHLIALEDVCYLIRVHRLPIRPIMRDNFPPWFTEDVEDFGDHVMDEMVLTTLTGEDDYMFNACHHDQVAAFSQRGVRVWSCSKVIRKSF